MIEYGLMHLRSYLMPRKTVRERFDAKYQEDAETGCWEWQAAKHTSGYATFTINGKKVLAHRASYEMHKGVIPEGLMVRHKCDNRMCVNPEHLELGTHQQNMQDMTSRNRQAKGERQGSSRLTEAQVYEIHRLRAERKISASWLALEFKVSKGMIIHILQGRKWAHVYRAIHGTSEYVRHYGRGIKAHKHPSNRGT